MAITVNYEEFYLSNGLRVVLHEDHATPIVAVNLWYHVGSKNELPGRTGFAHLFEHLMFEGSKHYDHEYFALLQEAGANVNGSTNGDRTNYYEVVPANFLELALWLEADRMGYLLDAMTQEKLDNQRDVVKNEKRQRYDNVPYGLVGEKIAALMYPPDHPYSWLTIGSMQDLSAASLDDVKNFFRRFYVPNNASLVLAGDFKPAEARELIEKYFALIPSGAEIVRPCALQPQLEREIRETFEDAVALPRVYLAWHSVPEYHADEAALDMLASILSAGRGARLQNNLVFEKQIAQDVSAAHFTREIAGQFQIISTAKPGKSIEEIETEIFDEIERVKKESPTDEEMQRALNTRESAYIYGLQTVLGKADQLNAYATMRGEPDYFAEDLKRYREVAPADISRVANQYLVDKKLVLTVAPKPDGQTKNGSATILSETNSIASPQTTHNGKKKHVEKSSLDAEELIKTDPLYAVPQPKADFKLSLPKPERYKLSNGLDVLLVAQNKLPIVSMNLVIKTGAAANSIDKAGLSNMTANLLKQGTQKRSAIEIANELQSIGAQLGTGSGWDSATANLLTLTEHLERALEILADVIVNPSFPESELEIYRKRLLTAFLQQKDNANAIANVVYNILLYGEKHPYGKPIAGDEKSVNTIARADAETFHKTFYRPNNATLVVVGDVVADKFLPQLETAFASWQPAAVPAVYFANEFTKREATDIYLVDKPNAAQSVISIGQTGVARNNPDYFPLVVMNSLLGGQFTSRMNMNLREDKGYTYGARTNFEFRRGAGPFAASTSVQTAVTKESVLEILKELEGVRGSIPVTQKELEYNKQSLIRRYPGNFETAGQVGAQLAALVIYDLPDSYFNDYIAKINAVTIEDINRVANQYLEPSKMAILVVGDRKTIEPISREIENIEINFLDIEGRPLIANELF